MSIGPIPMQTQLASRRERVRAAFIDGLLFLPLLLINRIVEDSEIDQTGVFLYFLLTWQLGWLYSVLLHGWNGRTIGKAIIGIRVVRHRDRDRLGWRRAFLRDLPYILLIAFDSVVWVYWNLETYAGRSTAALDEWAFQVFDTLKWINVGWLILEVVTMYVHPERR